MAFVNDAWTEYQRRRWLRPDAERYIRPDAARFMRPDAQRYFQPDAWRAYAPCLPERKHWSLQPRVPAGNSDGGQWADEGGSLRLIAAGLPKIPSRRPPTSKEQTKYRKAMAIALAELGASAAAYVLKDSWLYEAFPYISAYLDAPRTLGELHELAASPAKGYDIHHIVEQTSAERDGFSRSLIDRGDNLVRIQTMKHWEINGWYQTKNEDFGGVSPREYPRGKDWDERRRVGLFALGKFGVLAP